MRYTTITHVIDSNDYIMINKEAEFIEHEAPSPMTLNQIIEHLNEINDIYFPKTKNYVLNNFNISDCLEGWHTWLEIQAWHMNKYTNILCLPEPLKKSVLQYRHSDTKKEQN